MRSGQGMKEYGVRTKTNLRKKAKSGNMVLKE
jgi:hypothetical protein